MRKFGSLQFALLVGFVLVVIVISTLSYFTISNIVGDQSRQQLQATSTVFSLVEEELIKPMHIAQTLARADIFKPYMNAEPEQIRTFLQDMQSRFELMFFIASEPQQMQYYSDGDELALSEEETPWYFRLKERQEDFYAGLGHEQDLRLYMDIMQRDMNGDLLGFVGIGMPLSDFVDTFSHYNQELGYDFVFVNSDDEIVLTSFADLQPRGDERTRLQNLSWYSDWYKGPSLAGNQTNLVELNEQDVLITEVPLDVLKWRFFIISPLEAQQQAMSRTFLVNLVIMTAALLTLLWLLSRVIRRIQQSVSSKIYTDRLTGLFNRLYIEQAFEEIQQEGKSMSLIMADIDHFKEVNDTHGHNVGDQVIASIADILGDCLRKGDYLGRWGGEEFIVLLPNSDLLSAEQVAERMRQSVAFQPVAEGDMVLDITMSFGVTQADRYGALVDLIHSADKALYQAKNEGRNRVVSRAFNQD
ncbi:sensor domain-containing diguanylate cyclase [Lacimicrobium alkaliphilum]|uniref:diguanylate cyclase n=1 Tax=Lacimicrobium alkaliphilum TaxID=1526571 RepID=A0ABQ1RU97_9ALTE|nr:sensor domain-containing diguanylate cyclase [Lacimicrobium alkaliphilum]GGD78980.1 GGDEF domain-containing protein [Lacimicrobium alkaliphilum]